MGRSRGDLTSKIHALVDADGRAVALRLTGGLVHDSPEAEALLDAMPEGATLSNADVTSEPYVEGCGTTTWLRPVAEVLLPQIIDEPGTN